MYQFSSSEHFFCRNYKGGDSDGHVVGCGVFFLLNSKSVSNFGICENKRWYSQALFETTEQEVKMFPFLFYN